jgi:hypothetical protein
MELFEFINNAYLKKENITSKTGFKDVYMANRFLSMNPSSFLDSWEANNIIFKIPVWAGSCLLYHAIKRRKKAPRNDYIKAEKVNLDKSLVDIISNYLCCSNKHAKETLVLLNKIGVDVRVMFGIKSKGK